MGKTPKSKNVDDSGKSHLQEVLLHRPKNTGNGRMLFPGISKQSVPKRRMKLSGTLSRKSSHGKGVNIKVSSSSIAEQDKKKSKLPRMSVVATESSVPVTSNHQADTILENGNEVIQEAEETKGLKDKPVANGSEAEATVLAKSESGEVHENSSHQAKEINSIREAVVEIEPISSVKLPKDDEAETKKRRSRTPQSRSSPQRKSGRVRSKHDSPIKSNASTLTPALKILKINLTPSRNITNGTVEVARSIKTTAVESHKALDSTPTNEKRDVDVEVANDVVISEAESSKPHAADVNPTYLRSLRMVSGRRSLTSNSPMKSLPVSSPTGSNTGSSSQLRKRQGRKKESTHTREDSDFQGTDNEFNSSVNSGKRKAEKTDDQSVEFPIINPKKCKNEEDDIKLFLPDESEENNHFEIESEDCLNSSQLSKSSDDEFAELKDLSESDRSDDLLFVKKESMEYAYEAREIESKQMLHEIPTTANQSSNKRWCILM